MFFVKSKQHSYFEMFEGIVIGASVAAAATFLFGTKKGKKIQKDLVHQYKKAGRVTNEMKHKFNEAIHTGLSKTKRKVTKAKRATKKIKAKVKRESKRVKSKAQALKREELHKAA
jgi:gas vesicle protein